MGIPPKNWPATVGRNTCPGTCGAGAASSGSSIIIGNFFLPVNGYNGQIMTEKCRRFGAKQLDGEQFF